MLQIGSTNQNFSLCPTGKGTGTHYMSLLTEPLCVDPAFLHVGKTAKATVPASLEMW